MIAYTVSASFDDARIAQEWLDWLRDEHLADVLAAGALDAAVIRLDSAAGGGGSVRCEVRYHFESRAAFAAYERDHAPRLRTEGLKRFGPERGIKYERSLGDVCIESTQILRPQ